MQRFLIDASQPHLAQYNQGIKEVAFGTNIILRIRLNLTVFFCIYIQNGANRRTLRQYRLSKDHQLGCF